MQLQGRFCSTSSLLGPQTKTQANKQQHIYEHKLQIEKRRLVAEAESERAAKAEALRMQVRLFGVFQQNRSSIVRQSFVNVFLCVQQNRLSLIIIY